MKQNLEKGRVVLGMIILTHRKILELIANERVESI